MPGTLGWLVSPVDREAREPAGTASAPPQDTGGPPAAREARTIRGARAGLGISLCAREADSVMRFPPQPAYFAGVFGSIISSALLYGFLKNFRSPSLAAYTPGVCCTTSPAAVVLK